MRADNSHHLVAAARRRAADTWARATSAIRALADAGEPVTFETVAARAQVSRAWLYSTDDLRTQISERRNHTPHERALPPPPARQRASGPSLLRRLEIAQERIQRLTADNAGLRRDLERALGQVRTARPPATPAAKGAGS
jgi:Family of unknown function (DUF6262)